LKRVPYSEVKVEPANAFKGDPAFTAMRKAFADAVARKKIDPNDEGVDWYFTLSDSTPVAKAPADSGAPIGKVGKVALPVLGRHPPSPEDKPVTLTHYEVLMPNGRTGWIPASAARPLEGN
jgi:hypothetical protein